MYTKTALLICAISLPLVECVCGSATNSDTASTARIRLATTTSTKNSGLLSAILPPFEKESGVKVDLAADLATNGSLVYNDGLFLRPVNTMEGRV